MAALVALFPILAGAQMVTPATQNGWTIGQITEDSSRQTDVRSSPNGRFLVWTLGNVNSQEIQVHDLLTGITTTRTSDGLDKVRPTIADNGDIAYQGPGNSTSTEIYYLAEGATGPGTQLTSNAVEDRYPDINNAGQVVWSNNTGGSGFIIWTWSSATGVLVGQEGYRPQINGAGRWVGGASGADVYEFDGTFVRGIPNAASLGYCGGYRRRTLAENLDMAIEADPGDDPGAESCNTVSDLTGTRTIFHYDGVDMTPLYTSPAGVWHGRPELNSYGFVAWEGYGCIGPCSGPTDDTEIFVYDPRTETITQLTDDDVVDKWPEVLPDGRVIWYGQGRVEGYSGPAWDWEVFVATPQIAWEVCLLDPYTFDIDAMTACN